jgi:hypothetical protein
VFGKEMSRAAATIQASIAAVNAQPISGEIR